MPDFTEQHLDGSTFTRVSLRDANFTQVHLTDATFYDADLTGATFRSVYLDRVRMIGVVIPDINISGDLGRVMVNGVDVMPLVEAELNRRMPERALMKPVDPQGFSRAWDILERRWAETVERAKVLTDEQVHESVDGEYSFVQTLRHLSFATACWVNGIILAESSPWDPLDLPWDEAPGWDGVPGDREARPSLAEVLALRARRQATVRQVIEGLTPERLAQEFTSATPVDPRDGRPISVAEALSVILNEEWEHRLFAERDLDALTGKTTGAATDRNPAKSPTAQ